MDVSEARRLKALEDENARLKKLLAEVMLRYRSTEGGSGLKVLTVGNKREAVRTMRSETPISERRACSLVGLCRATQRYEPRYSAENDALTERIRDIALERRRFGYRRVHQLLRREGTEVNHKKVYRLYHQAGLAVRKRKRRKGIML